MELTESQPEQNEVAPAPKSCAFPFQPLESDPWIFSKLCQTLGVEGVQFEDVWSLDEDCLGNLKPIYGFIFLFFWSRSDSEESNEHGVVPDELYFANQVGENACATQGIINLVMNVPGLNIGEKLRSFKEFTNEFSPVEKGIAIANDEELNSTHNKFSRIRGPYRDFSIAQNHPRAKHNQFKKKKYQEGDIDENSVYHYLTYVPHIDGKVWELDGLKRAPRSLATYERNEDWYKNLIPKLQERMNLYSNNNIRFSLLALTQDKQTVLHQKRESELAFMKTIRERLDSLNPDWEKKWAKDQENPDSNMVLLKIEDVTDCQDTNLLYASLEAAVNRADELLGEIEVEQKERQRLEVKKKLWV
ncbi:ubiquitin carboxyl-terminal hydrolase [Nowakowskiella sp. JEL0407]|nr:ubiquitin carboxyl-terminal hydrolase [Nowakowskiella sp. JEL0407]